MLTAVLVTRHFTEEEGVFLHPEDKDLTRKKVKEKTISRGHILGFNKNFQTVKGHIRVLLSKLNVR